MKKPLLVLTAMVSMTAFIYSFQEATTPPLMVFENGILEVEITDDVARDKLLDLKKRLLEEHQVTLDFEELSYTKKGKIDRISIKVKSPNGESGSASSVRALGMIAPHVWFYVDFNAGAGQPFGIGAGVH